MKLAIACVMCLMVLSLVILTPVNGTSMGIAAGYRQLSASEQTAMGWDGWGWECKDTGNGSCDTREVCTEDRDCHPGTVVCNSDKKDSKCVKSDTWCSRCIDKTINCNPKGKTANPAKCNTLYERCNTTTDTGKPDCGTKINYCR